MNDGTICYSFWVIWNTVSWFFEQCFKSAIYFRKLEHCYLIYEQGFKFLEKSSRFGTLFINQGTVLQICYPLVPNLSHFLIEPGLKLCWGNQKIRKRFSPGIFLKFSTRFSWNFPMDSNKILIAKFQIWLDLEMPQIDTKEYQIWNTVPWFLSSV